MEKMAFDIIDDNDPEVISIIYHKLQRGQTPSDIADEFMKRDVIVAALVERAAVYMLENPD